MKNEVQRLRISFANFPIGNQGANLNHYTLKTAKETILTCVQVEESGQFNWEVIDIGPCRAFYNQGLYGFKCGAAYPRWPPKFPRLWPPQTPPPELIGDRG